MSAQAANAASMAFKKALIEQISKHRNETIARRTKQEQRSGASGEKKLGCLFLS